MNIIIAKNYEEMSHLAGELIIDNINSNPNCILGFATGSTPLGLYKALINYCETDKVDFSHSTSFNLDEYLGLESNHPQSYRYFMDNNLFNHINIKKENTHVPNGMAENVEEECINYDNKIEASGGIDIQVLGVGNNGHIGFNEPSDALLVGTHVTELSQDTIEANSRFFNNIEEVPSKAITMGLGSIMKSKQIILLASGASKASIISRLVDGKIDTQLPASLLQVHQNVTLIVDEAAGSLLSDHQDENLFAFKNDNLLAKAAING